MMPSDQPTLYRFNDAQLDIMVSHNASLRQALIERQITKADYLAAERLLAVVGDFRASCAPACWKLFSEILTKESNDEVR